MQCLKLRTRKLQKMYDWWEAEIATEALEARKRTITFGEPMFCLSLNQGGTDVIVDGSDFAANRFMRSGGGSR